MTLQELAARVPGLAALPHTDKIKLFCWWLHTHGGKVAIRAGDVSRCYGDLNLAAPGNIYQQMDDLVRQSQLLKDSAGYRLERSVADALSVKYGQRDATIQVDKLLRELPARLANLQERGYLEETLICFRNQAFRAAIVMVWNLAYDHLCHWILADAVRLAAFNVQQAITYAKKKYPSITNRDSFEEMKEFEVVQVAASASLINGGMHTVLKEKLDRRNKAAHPSGLIIKPATAEDAIIDLIENVVLKLT